MTQRTVDAVWRIESARLIAGLARTVRDVGLAEDLAQDALVAALEQWPSSGVPDHPGAWLTAVARRRYVDGVRRQITFERKVDEIGRDLSEAENPKDQIEFDDHVEDDVLRLIFTACHPLLTREARVALTLKLVGGLSTEQIARAFLVSTPTMAARITRAKKALSDAGVPFEVPVGAELAARLASVLEVVYLIFNEGYSATSGESWIRGDLCEEAMRLGRMLAALAPDEAEAHGLVALMEIQASRLRARTGPNGEIVTLLQQDRGRWDRLLITHGLGALARAGSLAGQAELARPSSSTAELARQSSSTAELARPSSSTAELARPSSSTAGPYVIQAALAACHARATIAEDTDWVRISSLYGVLAAMTPSPIVELNRAVAVSMADGPTAALPIVDALLDEPVLRGYHLLPSVRGDLLERLGRRDEAHAEFERAAAMCGNERERDHLLGRAAACATDG